MENQLNSIEEKLDLLIATLSNHPDYSASLRKGLINIAINNRTREVEEINKQRLLNSISAGGKWLNKTLAMNAYILTGGETNEFLNDLDELRQTMVQNKPVHILGQSMINKAIRNKEYCSPLKEYIESHKKPTTLLVLRDEISILRKEMANK